MLFVWKTNLHENTLLHENKIFYNEYLLELEKNYDAKLTVFMETIQKEVDRKLKKIGTSLDNKINDIKTIIGSFKIQTQKQINELQIRESEKITKANIDEYLCEIKNIQIQSNGLNEINKFESYINELPDIECIKKLTKDIRKSSKKM